MKPPPAKAKAKYNAHFVVLKTVPSGEGGKLLYMDKTATAQNSVTLEAGRPVSKATKLENSVLSGSKQSKAALQNTCNVFSCDLIHNTGDSTLDKCQTDTDLKWTSLHHDRHTREGKADHLNTQHQSESRPRH